MLTILFRKCRGRQAYGLWWKFEVLFSIILEEHAFFYPFIEIAGTCMYIIILETVYDIYDVPLRKQLEAPQANFWKIMPKLTDFDKVLNFVNFFAVFLPRFFFSFFFVRKNDCQWFTLFVNRHHLINNPFSFFYKKLFYVSGGNRTHCFQFRS